MTQISRERASTLDALPVCTDTLVARVLHDRSGVYLASKYPSDGERAILLNREEVVALLAMMPENGSDEPWVEL